MKKLFYLLVISCFLNVAIFAQDLQKKSEENPLDYALNLLKTENDFGNRTDELLKLSLEFWLANYKTKALETLDLIVEDDKEKKVEFYLAFAENYLENGNEAEASELLFSSLKYIDKNEFDIGYETLRKIAYNLALTGNEVGANQLINLIEEKFFKAEFLVAMSDAYQRKGKTARALEVLPTALKYAQDSEFEKQKYSAIAAIAKRYAELDKKEISLKLLVNVETFASDDSEQFETVFQSYLQLKLYKKAEEVIKNNKIFNESELALKYAEINEKSGNREKAIKYVQKASLYEDEIFDDEKNVYKNEFLVDVVKLYLKLERDDLAFEFAKKIRKINPQHFSLLEIAKYNQAKKRLDQTAYILNYDFEQLIKTEYSQFDNEYQFTKASYLSDVANLSVEIKNFVLALKITNSLELPFHRAGGLGITVLKQKGLIIKEKAFKMLESANLLLRNDEESLGTFGKDRFWSIIAFDYADLGERDKSLKIFSEILNKIIDDRRMNSKDKINSLIF